MRMQTVRQDRFRFLKPAPIFSRSLMVAAGLLAAAPLQMVHAQTAPVFKQSVQHFDTLGQSTIHGGPVGSSAIATPEIRLETDDIGLKDGTSAAVRATARPRSNFFNHHGLPIPSKEAARLGLVSADSSNLIAPSVVSLLPPPPTMIPNPRGRSVVDSSSKVFGFSGLTHLDQRIAGTGVYTNTQFSLEPPDQALCVGGGFVVEAVNNAIAVYDTAGNLLTGPEALSQFWGLTPEIDRVTGITGQFISDPKCAYDKDTERWFVTELMQDTGTAGTGRNFNLIAVSKTSDPRGGFLVLSYDVTNDGVNGTPNHPGCPCFGDQPLLGFDDFGVYQSTNEFGATTFNGAQVYAIPKRGLVAAASHGDFSHLYLVSFDASQGLVPYGGLSYSIQPAVSFGDMDDQDSSGRGVEFFLSALQFGAPPYQLLDNRIAVWAMGNTRSLETLSPNLTLALNVIPSETYGQPNPAQQKPGPTPLGTSLGESLQFINTNDDRMNQVVYSGGLLYSGVNTLIGDGSRTGIAWFGVKPKFNHGNVSGRVVRQGYVAVDGESVIFPSLAFANGDDGIVGFTLVGPDYFPSAAYMKVGDDNSNSAVHIAADGAAPDDGFSGYVFYSGGNVARWGDYSAAVSDGNNVWFATEYIPNAPRSPLADWGTFVTKVRPQQ
jgi:hypothetical protein